MKSIPHLIQYQGSKRNLAPAILRYFPAGVGCLIEPFAGSAAVSIAAANRQLADSFIINDLNRPLIELLRRIVDHPVETADSYMHLWNEQHRASIEHYFKVREKFNQTQDPCLLLYLLARCVKGAVRYNSYGLFNQSPDKRRQGTRPSKMRANILGVSALLNEKTRFYSLDYRHVIAWAKPVDLVYMDPPYQGVSSERDARYFSGISHGEFLFALEELNSRNISYIVSYDGRRGNKSFGETLPTSLQLTRIELHAGRSSQSTLLGRNEVTYESLYISRALVERLGRNHIQEVELHNLQHALFETKTHYA
jgi:DNA adenine methylase